MNESHAEKRLGKGMLTVSWLIVLALLTLYFTHWQKQRENPNSMPMATSAEGVNELVLRRNYQHHYVMTGQINGKDVTFLLDTGATAVSVPQHLADDLGLKPGAAQWSMTANGTVEVRATTIDRLQLGSIALRDISANINPGMESDAVLLGMSALKHIEFTQRDGTLTLRQYY